VPRGVLAEMVHFGKYLRSHSVPEWNTQYVRYKQHKKVLKKIAIELEPFVKPSPGWSPVSSADKQAESPFPDQPQPPQQPHHEDAHADQHPTSSHRPTSLRHLSSSPDSSIPPPPHHDQSSLSPAPVIVSSTDPPPILAPPPSGPISSLVAPVLRVNSEYVFFDRIDSDLSMVNEFFRKQEAFFLSKIELLSEQLSRLVQAKRDSRKPTRTFPISPFTFESALRSKHHQITVDQKKAIEKAIRETYRGLQLLHNYKILNFTAFVKILKKFDKTANTSVSRVCLGVVESAYFHESRNVEQMMSQVEKVYMRSFATDQSNSGRKHALESLRRRVKPISNGVIFEVGVFVGLSFSLLVVTALIVNVFGTDPDGPSPSRAVEKLSSVLPVFRAIGLTTLYIWLWAVSTYLFQRFRINHEFIFEIDPQTELNSLQIFRFASIWTLIWFVLLDFFLYASLIQDTGIWDHVQPAYFGLALFVAFWCVALCPFDLFYRPTRLYLARTLWIIVRSPFSSVSFKDFYFCNQLCSLNNLLKDLVYSECYFMSGDFLLADSTQCKVVTNDVSWVLSFLPYYWRFMQCCRRYKDSKVKRNLYNAGKYFTSLTVTFWGLMHKNWPDSQSYLIAWICAAICSSIFSFIWDVKMDWGLLNSQTYEVENGQRHPLLRSRLILVRSDFLYYFAIISDFCFRITWVFTISPNYFGIIDFLPKDYITTLIYTFEILRRSQWNFYRLENEHWNNVELFRAVNIVPLKLEQVGFKLENENAKPNERVKDGNTTSNTSISIDQTPIATDIIDQQPHIAEMDQLTDCGGETSAGMHPSVVDFDLGAANRGTAVNQLESTIPTLRESNRDQDRFLISISPRDKVDSPTDVDHSTSEEQKEVIERLRILFNELSELETRRSSKLNKMMELRKSLKSPQSSDHAALTSTADTEMMEEIFSSLYQRRRSRSLDAALCASTALLRKSVELGALEATQAQNKFH